jgi:hypothetical protein
MSEATSSRPQVNGILVQDGDGGGVLYHHPRRRRAGWLEIEETKEQNS